MRHQVLCRDESGEAEQRPRERPSASTSLALVAGFAGLVLVALPGGGGSGAALSLLSAVAVTAGTLMSRRLANVDAVLFTGWHLLIGGAVLVGLATVVEGAPAIAWTPRFVLSLLSLAVAGTAGTTGPGSSRSDAPGSTS